jgi:hypothetical protein
VSDAPQDDRWAGRMIAAATLVVVFAGLFTAAPPRFLSHPSEAATASRSTETPSPAIPSASPVDGWRLVQLGASTAELTQHADAARVRFLCRCPGPSWQTQLRRSAPTPPPGGAGGVWTFEARSDAPARIDAVVESRGLRRAVAAREAIELAPEWRSFAVPFACGEDVCSVILRLDLGAAEAPVDVRRVEVRSDEAP